ncbi:MAG: hypothetical protein ABR559_03865 [Gemmatimonadota bacterium]
MSETPDQSLSPDPPGPALAPPPAGRSTGVKVAIGCGIALALGVIVLIVLSVAGGMFLKKKAGDLTGGLEAQQEAGETMSRLEQEHAFSPPADGIVSPERAERFLAATDDAWDEMQETIEELHERGVALDEEGAEAGLGDALAGARGLGETRVALVEALEAHEMPVSEYLWTGVTLLQAYAMLDQPAGQPSGVPPANLAVASTHREALAELADEDTDRDAPDKSFVLAMAMTWGMGDSSIVPPAP